MDALSRVLASVGIEGSVFCHGEVSAPWGFEGGAPDRALFHAVVEGEAWVQVAALDRPRRLRAGEILLLPRGGVHRMSSAPDSGVVPLGAALSRQPDAPFARFNLQGDGPRAAMICGTFRLDGLDWHPLLQALPDVVIVDAGVGPWLRTTLTALERQLEQGVPGGALITRHLAEILFVQIIAAWVEHGAIAGWVRALRDPQVGRAVGLIHGEPGARWTADSLARAVGLSRSLFYERFRALVGATPARYLTAWRMTLAARRLRADDTPIVVLADALGYDSLPAFARAFRRHHGMPPGAWRRAA